ncbi:preprotein translocase subunit YajC [Gaiella sp.]|uniref:preprotein translocase subunit YajC n=1 Tax=Gaiella sp. TaxID=2663207 RepID=UPI002E37611E|nr:preprotein translocase subunit YajC [Gaiella sp.]HEX5583736.1 preprotein translocase subunit YajC [Gaiella sp.]
MAPQLILVVAMLVLLWVLLIRPQRTRQRQQTELLSSIDPGDEVLTVGGLYGIVQEIDEEDDLIVEIADGVHVRIARRAVGAVVKPEADEDDEADEADEPDEGTEPAVGVDGVNDSEDFVSEQDAEDPAALERR